MQLLGLQQIVMQRDLRLLDLAEKHWGLADQMVNPLARPKESFNMVKAKVKAPMEENVRTAL